MTGLISRLPAASPPGLIDFVVRWTVDGHCLVLDFSPSHADWGSGCFAAVVDRFSRELLDVVFDHALHHHRQAERESILDVAFSLAASDEYHIDIT